ncbi:hypothetical protein MNBD_UNCLBAC01-1222 [hydrothermal vent metagenome]|uniref:DUF2283 domain-containing protein n=1 Tax=hydrothermal vent metagenome TaxID=652676 RepID=A0A3B1DHF3_9ZZZZ
MNINYDEADDAMYIRFSDAKYYQSDEVKEGVILDFDKEGRIIAFEVLDVSKRLPKKTMDSLHFEVSHAEK